jgi:hypothetical protein
MYLGIITHSLRTFVELKVNPGLEHLSKKFDRKLRFSPLTIENFTIFAA